MKAKKIYENIDFERGRDPKDQMEIGITYQFQKAIEDFLLRDANDSFIINSIAFPEYAGSRIDFVVDDWADDDTLERTLSYLMSIDSQNEFLHIFDFIDVESFTGGGYKNGVYKFTAKIDPAVTMGLRGKMILAEDYKDIKIIDL